MATNATALANYFIDLAKEDSVELKQLGLMKRVYIAHGFSLALFDKSALDPRFDVVEAWPYGPVIPSIYHSFKHNKDNPIIEKSIITRVERDGDNFKEFFDVPELHDIDIRLVAEMVWERYRERNDYQLVALTHRKGTPWALCYEEGKKNEIPDSYTKVFYKKLIKN
jgi:uncharacterized phage-associated protein